jgi:crotonobetainyl-CoA:carnitine CoA-transferase CaiB-like acyl-CoA transferase
VQALDQIRVVEIGQGVGVAFAGKLFADFGADVIKVEPPEGDQTRRWGPFPHDRPHHEASAAFAFFNRNKRGVTLDVSEPGARTLLQDLAAGADLVLAGMSLTELAAIGITQESLTSRRPGAVLASLTPFGDDGPYSGFGATDLVADCIAGPMSVNGNPGRAPLTKPFNIVASQVGNAFASAAMAAVFASSRGAPGQTVQVCATDVLMTCFDRRAICHMVYQLTGDIVSRPFGGSAGGVLPRGRNRCKDGWVEIATMPIWVPRMLAALGDAELTEYFAQHKDAATRPETAERVQPVLAAWLAERTMAECFETATLRNGWPVYPIYEPRDVLEDLHYRERGSFVELEHPVMGVQKQLGAPWRMGEGGFEARRAAPTLGQDNDDVWRGEVGVDAPRLARARALGVI